MFSATSGLNRRIEELENHKKFILEKLKQNTEKSDVDYIVKTQGLENIESKKPDFKI